MTNKKKKFDKSKLKKKYHWLPKCQSVIHPKFNGLPCRCAGCNPINYCLNETGGCGLCEGPVLECDGPDEEN